MPSIMIRTIHQQLNLSQSSRSMSLELVNLLIQTRQVNTDSACACRLSCIKAHKGVLFMLLLVLCNHQGTSQECDFPSTTVFSLLETDPAGTEIFNATSYNRSHVYRYTTSHVWLSTFLDLSLNDTDLFYYMRLTQALDLEEIYYNLSVTDISGFSLRLFCRAQQETSKEYYILVEAVSEWSPEFNLSSIELTVKETLPINSVVISLTNWASDYDVNPGWREIAEYGFLQYSGDPRVDGQTWLRMSIPLDGVVVVKKQLDYDELPEDKKFVLLGVTAVDRGGRTGTTSLTLNIEDDDTRPPGFTYSGCPSPCQVTYAVTVSPNVTGLVAGIKPANIQARDGDTLNYQIGYYIVQGPQNYEEYIMMNNITGQLTILQELGSTGLRVMALIVEAREASLIARSTRTTLLITVADGDKVEEALVSANPGDDTTFIVVATVLAVAVVTSVVLLIVLMVYFKKRYKKAIHPANSLTTLQAVSGLDGYRKQDEKTLQLSGLEKLQSNDEKTLLRETVLEKVSSQQLSSALPMKNNEHEAIYTLQGRPMPHKLATQLFAANRDAERAMDDRRQIINSQNSARSSDDNENSAENAAPNYETNNTVVSKSLPEKLNTNELHVGSSEQLARTSNIPPRRSLKVLTGLKILDEADNIDTQYKTVDLRSDGATNKGEPSDADRLNLNSSKVNIPIVTQSKVNSDQTALGEKNIMTSTTASIPVEVDLYDGTEDFRNGNLDSGFYTDSTKKRIKRSQPLPVTTLDPNDTRDWITISDDY